MTRPGRIDRFELALALILLLVGAGLRFALLDFNSFRLDEVYTYRLIEKPYSEIVSGTVDDVHPPLYYFLARTAWLALGGDPRALRGVSAVFAVASLFVMWGLARRFGGQRFGLWALGLLAISPLHLNYSVEARNYALGMFWAAAMLWSSFELLGAGAWGRRERMHAVLYTVAALGGVYTHNLMTFAVLVSGATMMATALMRRQWWRAAAFAAMHLIVFLGFLFWLWVIFGQIDKMGNALNWMPAPTPVEMERAFAIYLPFGWHHVSLPRFLVDRPEQAAPFFVGYHHRFAMVFALLGLLGAVRVRREGPRERAFLALALATLLVPQMLAYVVSAYRVRVFYPQRFALFQLPAYLVVLVWGMMALPWRALRVAALTTLAAAMVHLTMGFFLRPIQVETRDFVRQAADVLRPGEPLYYTAESRWSLVELTYQTERLLPGHELRFLPEALDESLERADAELPRRMVVLDWSAWYDPGSGKHGTYAVGVMQRSARARRLYTPHLAPELSSLIEYDRIDWNAIRADRQQHLAPWRDLLGLPWTVLRDAGGTELLDYNGFAFPDYSPQALSRWLVGGFTHHISYFPDYTEYTGPMKVGDYWHVAAMWEHPAGRADARSLTTQLRNMTMGPEYFAELPANSSLVVTPYPIRPLDYREAFEVYWRYPTWVPARVLPGSTDERALGPKFVWYGVLRRGSVTAADYPEAPLGEWPHEGGEAYVVAADRWVLSLNAELRAGEATGRRGYARDLLVVAEYRAPRDWEAMDDAAIEAEAITLSDAAGLSPQRLVPWREVVEGGRAEMRALIPAAAEGEADSVARIVRLVVERAGATRGEWTIRRIEVMRPFASLLREAEFPVRVSDPPK